MIFTVHDINLMDCKRMFRKEQIWFVHKDQGGVYVYFLVDFTAQQGVRDTTDIMEKYGIQTVAFLPHKVFLHPDSGFPQNRRSFSCHFGIRIS